MINLYKMQIACLIFLTYITWFYLRNKHVPTYAHKIYSAMLGIGIVNILFDILSVYTINHMQTVSMAINRFCHDIFIGTINIEIYLISLYIIFLIRRNNVFSAQMLIMQTVPLGAALVMVLFGPLYYMENGYAYGPAADTCYISIVFYIFLTVYFLARYWQSIELIKKQAIAPALVIMVLISGYQFFEPASLVSSLGVALVLFSVFLAMEDPHRYIHPNNKLFNQVGLVRLMDEWTQINKRCCILVISLQNIDLIREQYSQEILDKLLADIGGYVNRVFGQEVYFSTNRCLSIILPNVRVLENVKYLFGRRLHEPWLVNGVKLQIEFKVHEFAADEAKSKDTVVNEFLLMLNNLYADEAYVDALTGVYNRNALEAAMMRLALTRDKHSSIYAVVVDLNNLKKVNDTSGHHAGDRLIIDCAVILKRAAGDNAKIYRFGGDEFYMLFLDNTEAEMTAFLTRLAGVREEFNANSNMPISFALGYTRYDAAADKNIMDVFERADKLMYCQKRQMNSDDLPARGRIL